MPVNPLTGAPLPYGPGIGSPIAPGNILPTSSGGMWGGGGMGPGFPSPISPGSILPQQPPAQPPISASAILPQGAPPQGNPFIQQLLAMIRARRQNQFRPGLDANSLLPTGPTGTPIPTPSPPIPTGNILPQTGGGGSLPTGVLSSISQLQSGGY